MLVRSWLTTLHAQSSELKLASGLALASVIIILMIVLWSLFFSADEVKQTPDFNHNARVETIELPTLTKPLKTKTNKTEVSKPAKKKSAPQKALAKKMNAVTAHPAKPSVSKSSTPSPRKNSGKTTSIVLGQGNYYLQVGAFKQAKLARLMLEKMKRKYHDAKIKQKADKYAVWVGPVVTQDDAKQLQKYVQRKDNIKGFITTEK